MTVASEKDLVAIGVLAAQTRETVRAIEAAANELHIEPALRLNQVPYFDGRQVERLTEQLRGGK